MQFVKKLLCFLFRCLVIIGLCVLKILQWVIKAILFFIPITKNRKLDKKIRIVEEADDITDKMYMYKYNALDRNSLSRYLENSLQRKNIIEQKASNILISLSIIISIACTLIVYSDVTITEVICVALIALGIGFVYFLLSGFMAFSMIINKNKIFIPKPSEEMEDRDNKYLAFDIEFNELWNIKRNNYMAVSYKCLAFGFVFTIVSVLLFVTNNIISITTFQDLWNKVLGV